MTKLKRIIVLKSVQKRVVLTLRAAIIGSRSVGIDEENLQGIASGKSKAYDSQSNGFIDIIKVIVELLAPFYGWYKS